MKKIAAALLVIVFLLGAAAYAYREQLQRPFFTPRSNSSARTAVPASSSQEIEVVADNLEIPWEIEFLPNGDLLVTERPGRLVRIQGKTHEAIEVAGVHHIGEGGLMGLVLHPDFATNKLLYLYLTTRTDSGLTNRVERYTYDQTANQLSNRQIIIDNIPGAFVHDGGRIAFGPDQKLYITTGDAGTEESAQNTTSLAGKILRFNDDGSLPPDNPFNNATFSYGHRNPQGIAWDDQGRLWASEHGPSGNSTGFDEVNLIEKGANYGWPTIRGDQTREGMRPPQIQSGSEDTWAPAALEIVDDTLYFVGLRGEALYSARIEGNTLTNLTEHFKSSYGRLRIVKLAPDGALYLGTSNRDGRGAISDGDDKIIRLSL